MTGEVPVTTVQMWLLLGVAFCFGAAMLARSRSPTLLWSLWGTLLLVVVVALQQALRETTGGPIADPLHTFYFLTALLGIPSGASLAFAIARARTPGRRSVFVEALYASAVMMAFAVVGVMVALVPDFVRFGAQ